MKPVNKSNVCVKIAAIIFILTAGAIIPQHAKAQASTKPNILVIFGDDIGQSNISAYTHGVVGYQTPNIEFRIVEV